MERKSRIERLIDGDGFLIAALDESSLLHQTPLGDRRCSESNDEQGFPLIQGYYYYPVTPPRSVRRADHAMQEKASGG
jgi:hypothetical protein